MSDDPNQGASPAGGPPPGSSPAGGPPPAGEPPGIDPAKLSQRISELESFLSERVNEISGLKSTLEEYQGKIVTFEKQGHAAVALADEREAALARVLQAYRTAIMQAHPDIPEEMVTGNTLDELQANLAKAKDLVKKIRGKMPAPAPGAPAGAPVRTGPDFSSMSPREKIVQGLRK